MPECKMGRFFLWNNQEAWQVGYAPELIEEGKTGFTFHTGNADDLFHCIKKFESRDAALQMGKEALKHIEHFSLEKIAEVIEEEVMK